MGTAERQHATLDGVLRVLQAGGRAQALGCDGTHGRQGILDAVMQFPENEFLQLVGRLAFLGVDARLGQQNLGVDHGLFQQ